MRLVRMRTVVGGCVLAASLAVTGGASAGPSARANVQLGAAVHAWMAGAATVTSPNGLSNEQVNIDTNPPEAQSDPTVAVSLRDPDVAVAAYYDRSSVVTGVARTSDGGRHWSAQRITLRDHADTSPCFAFYPQVAYSLRDDAFYLFVNCGELTGLNETQLLASVDGGLTWTSPLAGSLVDANHAPGSTTVTDPSSFELGDAGDRQQSLELPLRPDLRRLRPFRERRQRRAGELRAAGRLHRQGSRERPERRSLDAHPGDGARRRRPDRRLGHGRPAPGGGRPGRRRRPVRQRELPHRRRTSASASPARPTAARATRRRR